MTDAQPIPEPTLHFIAGIFGQRGAAADALRRGRRLEVGGYPVEYRYGSCCIVAVRLPRPQMALPLS